MSRFLSSFRRLAKKLRKLEAEHGVGNLGEALRQYALNGKLPADQGLRNRLWEHLAYAEAMAATLPGIPPDAEQEPCNCGVCEVCQAPKPLHEWQQGHIIPGPGSGRGR
jgi:hypothetical protein